MRAIRKKRRKLTTCQLRARVAFSLLFAQVVDSGLDKTSCFFSHDDGLTIEHGYVFRGFRRNPDGQYGWEQDSYSLEGGYFFPYDMSRRKAKYVQYTRYSIVKVVPEPISDPS